MRRVEGIAKERSRTLGGWTCPVVAVLTWLIASRGATAGAITFTERDAWFAAVGAVTTIGFSDFPKNTFITNQYSELGVLFTDGDDFTEGDSPTLYLVDGWGLDGFHDITLLFDSPQRCIAVDHPGYIQIDLFNRGVLQQSIPFGGPGGYGNFAGVISLEQFDSAVLIDHGGIAAEIDDLHFGASVCGPDLDGDGRVALGDLMGLLNAWGTHPQGPPDLDGDGNVGIVDFLELLQAWGLCPFVPDCNGNDVWDLSDLDMGTSPDCNANAVPDECDVADGTSPDYDADGIPDECQPPPNDNCQDAIVITDGAVPFNTVGATEVGPPAFCSFLTVVNDVWFVYTPSCTGMATFSLCNDATFDTRLAVYLGASCPPQGNPQACSEDVPGCGLTSEIEMPVIEGFPYLVRVGGAAGGGIGVLTVSCEPFS